MSENNFPVNEPLETTEQAIENTENDVTSREIIEPTQPSFSTEPSVNIPRKPKYRFPKVLFAGFRKRFWAYIIDILLATSIANIIINLVSFAIKASLPTTVLRLTNLIIIALYFVITTYITGGQTLGKMIFGLRVVHLKEERLSLATVLVREGAGRIIHLFNILSVLYLFTAFTDRKQNLSDYFCDTSVIDLAKEEIYNKGKLA